MITALTVVYLLCFQAAALPAIRRVWARRSSADLSIWREVTLLAGIVTQFGVMVLTGADWRVRISPLCSGVSIGVLLIVIWRHR